MRKVTELHDLGARCGTPSHLRVTSTPIGWRPRLVRRRSPGSSRGVKWNVTHTLVIGGHLNWPMASRGLTAPVTPTLCARICVSGSGLSAHAQAQAHRACTCVIRHPPSSLAQVERPFTRGGLLTAADLGSPRRRGRNNWARAGTSAHVNVAVLQSTRAGPTGCRTLAPARADRVLARPSAPRSRPDGCTPLCICQGRHARRHGRLGRSEAVFDGGTALLAGEFAAGSRPSVALVAYSSCAPVPAGQQTE